MVSALDTLDYTYAAVAPATRKQQEVLKYSLRLLGEIRDTRGIRVLRSLGALQVLLWVVTLTGTAVAIVFPWAFGSPNINATMLMSILSTLLMTSVVLVVLKLSYPFSGEYGISPTPYAAFIHEVSARGSQSGLQPAPDRLALSGGRYLRPGRRRGVRYILVEPDVSPAAAPRARHSASPSRSRTWPQ